MCGLGCVVTRCCCHCANEAILNTLHRLDTLDERISRRGPDAAARLVTRVCSEEVTAATTAICDEEQPQDKVHDSPFRIPPQFAYLSPHIAHSHLRAYVLACAHHHPHALADSRTHSHLHAFQRAPSPAVVASVAAVATSSTPTLATVQVDALVVALATAHASSCWE
jgi:hypothetical protein